MIYLVSALIEEKFQWLYQCFQERRRNLSSTTYHYTLNANTVAVKPEMVLPQIPG